MIHQTAVIEKGAKLADDVQVGAYAVIEKGVQLASGVKVGPRAHIKGDTLIGEDTFIGTGALIGEVPQIKGFKGPAGKIRVGRDNVIREYVTIHAGSSPEKITRLGDNNFLMGFSHLAHDCDIKNNVVVCNGALVAGHVEVQDNAFVSGYVTIHQFVRVGRLSMIGGLSRVNQDVPPFMMVVGDSRVWGINAVGLRRAGFAGKETAAIKKAFGLLYRKGRGVSAALDELEKSESPAVKELAQFIHDSKRGICGPKRGSFLERLFLDYPYFVRALLPNYNLAEHNKKFPSPF